MERQYIILHILWGSQAFYLHLTLFLTPQTLVSSFPLLFIFHLHFAFLYFPFLQPNGPLCLTIWIGLLACWDMLLLFSLLINVPSLPIEMLSMLLNWFLSYYLGYVCLEGNGKKEIEREMKTVIYIYHEPTTIQNPPILFPFIPPILPSQPSLWSNGSNHPHTLYT